MSDSNIKSCKVLLFHIYNKLTGLGLCGSQLGDGWTPTSEPWRAELTFLGSKISLFADDKTFTCAIEFSREALTGSESLSDGDKERIDRSAEIMVRTHYDMDCTIEAAELPQTNQDLVALSILAAVSIYSQTRLAERLQLVLKK